MIGKSFNCCIIGVLSSLGYSSGAFMCTSCWKGTSPSGPVNLCHLDLSHLWQRREDQTPTAEAVVWLKLWFGSSAAFSSEGEQPPDSPATWEEGPGAGTYMRGHTGLQTRHMQHTHRSSRPLPPSFHLDRHSQTITAEVCPAKCTCVTQLLSGSR